MVLLFLFLGCAPTCEQTCSKLYKCGEVSSSEDVCISSCSAQQLLYEGWEEAHEEQQKEDMQNAEASDEETESADVEQVILAESTDSTEDREESPHYSEQFDLWKTCISQSTCAEISEGMCYDAELYPF